MATFQTFPPHEGVSCGMLFISIQVQLAGPLGTFSTHVICLDKLNLYH